MKNNWIDLSKPIIALAPMADYTDKPFSLICKQNNASVIFREMVSADAIMHHNEKTLKMINIDEAERPVIQQIFGSNPKIMSEAAKSIYDTVRPDGIDINMGCPAQKVVKNFHGCALIKDLKLAADIIQAVKNAVPVPVSVKVRLGWSQKTEILDFAPVLEQAGADLISIHGRTKAQGYADDADWKMIGKVRNIIKIPILANGSIFAPNDIQQCLDITKAQGVLIARGALGNPWIFKNIKKENVNLEEFKNTILSHAKLQVEHYDTYGMILFRKHLMFYFKGIGIDKEIKQKLTKIESLDQLIDILNSIHSLSQKNNIA